MAVSTEHRPRLIHSIYKAAWITTHVLVGCLLISVALGDFAQDASGAKAFVVSDLAAVMTHLKTPLHPLVALAVLFTTLAACLHLITLLWHRLMEALAAENLDRLTCNAVTWAAKRQFFSAWLLVPLVLNGVILVGARVPLPYAIAGVVLVSVYVLPVLVLRPRWLGSATPDASWFPSGTALTAFVLMAFVIPFAFAAILEAISDYQLGLELSGLALNAYLSWLAASALITVRNRKELWPHLRTRLQRRFLYLIGVATVRPLQLFLIWLLPPLLLVSVYVIFVAPTVSHVAAYLPPAAVALHEWVSTVSFAVTNNWYLHLIPTLAAAFWLYVGRCIVLSDESVQTGTVGTG